MRQSPYVNYAPFSWVSPPSNETQVKGRGKAVKNEGGTTTYSADRTTFYGNFHLFARKRCPYAFHSVNPHLLSATVAITQKTKKWSQALTHTHGSLRPLNATASWGVGLSGSGWQRNQDSPDRKCLHNAQMPTRAQDLAVSSKRSQLHLYIQPPLSFEGDSEPPTARKSLHNYQCEL